MRIIDGLGRSRERATIVVHDSRIVAVDDDRQIPVPRGAREIDVHGMTVLPGLIDCHVHFSLGGEADVVGTIREDAPALTVLKAAQFARRTLEAGFTTVRDLGFRDHSIFGLKQAINMGLIP
ncbi:MAG: amidohydrolase, partial [Nitrospiraceae bacterium]